MTRSMTSGRLRTGDRWIVWIIAAFGLVVLLALLFGPKLADPQEDAVILFQYSRNLAQTGVISFIAHGPRAEGATDFLWMLMIAGGFKLGINPAWLVAVMNFVSLLLAAFLLLRLAKRPFRPVPVLFIAGVFGMMPQVFAAITCFSVLPFAVLLLLLITCFVERRDAALAAVALLTCLFRPDGVVFVLPILVAALVLYPERGRRLGWIAALFVLPGILYFAWRWHYFGERLPLPFLVKADTPRIAHFLVLNSLQQVKPLLLLLVPFLFLALRRNFRDRRVQAIALCMLGVPLCFYLAMRLDQDVGLRFFIFLFAVPSALIALEWEELAPRLPLLLRSGALLWVVMVMPTWALTHREASLYEPTNRRDIAEQLNKLPHGTIVMSEAGVLPYYSRWPSYDTWGLNTPEFAHRLFQPSDVARFHPDIVLLYTFPNAEQCVPQPDWETPYSTRDWEHMTRNLATGVHDGNYDLLILPYGSPEWRRREGFQMWEAWQECWFVRRDAPERDQIEQLLRSHYGLTLDEWRARNRVASATPHRPLHGVERIVHSLWEHWLRLVTLG